MSSITSINLLKKERHNFCDKKVELAGSPKLVFLDSQWTAPGLPMDRSWIPGEPLARSGQLLDSSWIPGQPLDRFGRDQIGTIAKSGPFGV